MDFDLKIFGQTGNGRVNSAPGFTIVEVIVAGSIMIILSIGILTIFSNVVQRNRGENLRMQALSVLQREVEAYRSLKFVPLGTSTSLNAGSYTNPLGTGPRTSADGQLFNINVVITNFAPPDTTDANCRFKEIQITATPVTAQSGWLANLKTTVTIQRVRSN